MKEDWGTLVLTILANMEFSCEYVANGSRCETYLILEADKELESITHVIE